MWVKRKSETGEMTHIVLSFGLCIGGGGGGGGLHPWAFLQLGGGGGGRGINSCVCLLVCVIM